MLAVLFTLLAFPASSIADTVYLKTGGRVEGKIIQEDDATVVIETKFGVHRFARSEVKRVERKETPEQVLDQRLSALSSDDADGVYELAVFANENHLRKRYEELLLRCVAVNPLHAEANRELGRVLYRGRYVLPQERELLEKESRKAELLAQGLVEHEGVFVTPEEKAHLEKGLVLRDGKWLARDEAMVLDGFVQVDGKWVRGEEHWVDQVSQDVGRVIGKSLTVVRLQNVVVYTDVQGDFAKKLAGLLEKGIKAFRKEFGCATGLDWLGGRRIDVFVFRLRFGYEKFVRWLGQEKGMGANWAERATRVVSIYRYDNAWALGATYMANKGEAFTAAHCANMVGHVLINRFQYDGSKLPPFFDEAFAALFEYDLLGRNVVFSLGTGRYERSLQKDERKFFEDGQWSEALRESMRSLSDTPLEKAVRRDRSTLIQMDVAKGMCLLKHWRALRPDALPVFFSALRESWPGGDLPPSHAHVLIALKHAFRVLDDKDIPQVDQVLRKFAMQKLK